jgi:phosphoheptose isomerase
LQNFSVFCNHVTTIPAIRDIQAVRPGMKVLKLSAKTGEGMQEFLDYLPNCSGFACKPSRVLK